MDLTQLFRDGLLNQMVVLSFMWVIEYCLVIIAVLCDLYSGVQKAKRLGVVRSSYGYRRTIDKTSRYFNILFGLSVLDLIQLGAIWYLNGFEDYDLPLFIWFTTIGVIFVCFIEVKSIYEKAEDKQRFIEVGELAGKIITDRANMEKVAEHFGNYLNDTDENKEEDSKKE